MPGKSASFLQDALNRSGWSGGKPSTGEEDRYILDYMERTGRAPTQQDLGQWKAQVHPDDRNLTIRAGSTMADLGWGGMTMTEARAGGYGGYEPFGPTAGALVPENSGMVATDETGRAFRRFSDPDSPLAQRYREAGQYIPQEGYSNRLPDSMALADLFSEGVDDVSKYYTKSTAWQPPEMDEALGGYSPQDVNLARAKDYVTRQIAADAPKIKSLQAETERLDQFLDAENRRIANDANLTNEQAQLMWDNIVKTVNSQMEVINGVFGQLMTEDTAASMLDEIQTAYSGGLTADQWPGFSDFQDVTGAEVQGLYNKALPDFEQRWRQSQPPQPPMGQQAQPANTGTEQRDYLTYVERLNLDPTWKNQLMNDFWIYVASWRESGEPVPFMDWIINYFKGGR